MITDLVDYLNNNLLIAHYCGFDISAPLPSYWTFDRFLKQLDNDVLSSIMKSQVLYLSKQGIPLNKRSKKNPKLLPHGNPIVSLKL